MREDLHRLVYYSRNCLDSSPDQIAAGIRHILETSRTNNPRVGMIGALMFNRACFAQVLGECRQAVEATFERIQQDEQRGPLSARSPNRRRPLRDLNHPDG